MPNSEKKDYLEILKKLVLEQSQNCSLKIILYGSRAKGNARRYSDIDIAILPKTPLPASFITHLKTKIEESTIPYSVDVVDLSQTDEVFRNKVLREGIIWKD